MKVAIYYIHRIVNILYTYIDAGQQTYRSVDNFDESLDGVLSLFAIRTDNIKMIFIASLLSKMLGHGGFTLYGAEMDAYQYSDIIQEISKIEIVDNFVNPYRNIIREISRGVCFDDFINTYIVNSIGPDLSTRICELLMRICPTTLSKLLTEFNLTHSHVPDEISSYVFISALSEFELVTITYDTIQRAKEMKELVLARFIDNDRRSDYILMLDILLGSNVTIDKNRAYPIFVYNSIVSVMHGQAFRQLAKEQLLGLELDQCHSEVIYDPSYITNFSNTDLVSLVISGKLLSELNYKLINIPLIKIKQKTSNIETTKLIHTGELVDSGIIIGPDELDHLAVIPKGLPVVITSTFCLNLIEQKYDLDCLNIIYDNGWYDLSREAIRTLLERYRKYDRCFDPLVDKLITEFN